MGLMQRFFESRIMAEVLTGTMVSIIRLFLGCLLLFCVLVFSFIILMAVDAAINFVL